MDTSRKIHIYHLFLILSLVFCLLLIIRIAVITLFPDNPSADNTYYSVPDLADHVERGTIFDRNGIILAAEVPYYTCAVMIQSVDSKEKIAEILSPILFMTKTAILEQMQNRTIYAVIKHRLSKEEISFIQQKLDADVLPGIIIEKRYGRIYPQKFHAAQLIGFTNRDNVGLEGLEYSFNDLLYPLPEAETDITVGKDLYLTIDLRIQFFVDRQMELIAEKHNPDSASAIVMNADTGEILAWSSYPWYDLNSYSDSTPEQRLNRPAVAMYEPGSVFKIYSLASILNIGDADTEKRFICDGTYSFTMSNGNTAVINCVSPHGEVGPREILKYSCNGAIAHLALQTNPESFYNSLLDYGFSSTYNLQIPGEASGLLSPPDKWSGRSIPTISFGQEIGVTALQMTTAATVFSNNGMLLQPDIIAKIVNTDGSLYHQFERTEIRQVLKKENALDVLNMMTSATEPGGTAIYARAPDVTTAAKTGTAQILDAETHTYSPDHVLASCISLFPAENPEYIIYIAVDYPKSGQFYGSSVAAPSIGAITSDLVSAGLASSSKTTFLIIPGENSESIINPEIIKSDQ